MLPLRARDVVQMGRYARLGLLGRKHASDDEVCMRSMERMGIADLANAPLRSLSGGQQQRVFLAQVLAREADLLVLDEPGSGLDAGGRERYLRAIAEERARGVAVVTATHDISEASACDEVMLLARRVVAQGSPTEVLTPENLLATFGIALRAVEHIGHTDLLETEAPHGHIHDDEHGSPFPPS